MRLALAYIVLISYNHSERNPSLTYNTHSDSSLTEVEIHIFTLKRFTYINILPSVCMQVLRHCKSQYSA